LPPGREELSRANIPRSAQHRGRDFKLPVLRPSQKARSRTQGVKFEAGRASLAGALEIGQAAGVLITQACAKLAAQEAE